MSAQVRQSFLAKLRAMVREHPDILTAGTHKRVRVIHGDDCRLWFDEACSCDPELHVIDRRNPHNIP